MLSARGSGVFGKMYSTKHQRELKMVFPLKTSVITRWHDNICDQTIFDRWLIHLANPLVVITIFTCCPYCTITSVQQSFQGSLIRPHFSLTVCFWDWPCGSLMTSVLLYWPTRLYKWSLFYTGVRTSVTENTLQRYNVTWGGGSLWFLPTCFHLLCMSYGKQR